ncbi:unnamed protein product [Cylindrotheca closterium]|uniref:Uncharacterized protein n=1 Tax=Cylindrotheca closterium TaxID=2856 RepID=A0AAD2GB34_9STRA|nr:unnamed protein product [Cylindrotheca closterium]
MAAVPPFFTVHDNMVICGINNVTLFQGRTQAERIAYEIFSDDFTMTMDSTTPGRDGVPLSYIVRMNNAGILTLHEDFLEIYINMAPHIGEAYVMNNAKVLVLLSKFIVGNTKAEATLQAIHIAGNGREAFKALHSHYEGKGILASDIVKAEHTIKELCYVGEKPKMNWSMFERMLKKVHAACDKHEGREVHSEAMKLRSLQSKVTAPFLQLDKTAINTEIGKRPLLMTFTTALQIYRTAVREKFPQGTSNATDRGRYLSETRADNDCDRSRSQNNGGGNKRRNEQEIALSNGEKI